MNVRMILETKTCCIECPEAITCDDPCNDWLGSASLAQELSELKKYRKLFPMATTEYKSKKRQGDLS